MFGNTLCLQGSARVSLTRQICQWNLSGVVAKAFVGGKGPHFQESGRIGQGNRIMVLYIRKIDFVRLKCH